MKYKFITTISIALASALTAQFSLAQTAENSNELFELCSKFPNNTKCKGIEVPIPIEERSGEEVNCNFRFDPGDFNQEGECKLVFNEQGITVYQEQGDKIELLDNKRDTSETKITSDRIFITNYQLWNKIHRWEVGFSPENSGEQQSQTNFMVVFMDKDQAESLATKIESLSSSKPELVAEILSSSVYQKPDINQLLETKECEYCDLSNADLSGVDLEGANLVGANLQGANLQQANLEVAYLLGANLQGADLTDADFTGTNLAFATLNEATLVSTDFEGANLQQADLQQANLEGADLTAPSFLKGANLQGANLTDANLGGANLEQTNLQGANLQGANLRRIDVKLKDIPNNYSFGERAADYFIGFPVFGLSSGGVDFDTNLDGANLKGANLSNTDLKKVSFGRANLTNVNFTESNLDEDDLEEATVCGVTLADGSKSDRDCKQ